MTSTAQQPGTNPRGQSTRNQILESAMVTFAEQGYRGGSLRDIAAKCGVGHSTLLYHFPTKEKLLMAVLEYRERIDSQQVQLTGATGVDALRAWVRLAEHNTNQRGLVELFTTLAAEATSPDHPAHEYFIARYARSRTDAAHAFEQADDAGALRPGIDPTQAGAQLVALMDGLQIQWLLDSTVALAPLVAEFINQQLTTPLAFDEQLRK